MLKQSLGAVVALGLMAGTANAATIVQTVSLGPQNVSFTEADSSLSEFDPTLGTLNSVVVDYTVTSTVTSLTVTNSSPTTATGNADFWTDAIIDFDSTLGVNPSDNGFTVIGASFVPDTDDVVSFVLGLTVPASVVDQVVPLSSLDTTSSSFSGSRTYTAGDLALFTGLGTVTTNLITQGRTVTSFSGGSVGFDVIQEAFADLTITYNYTPDGPPPEVVPAPAALAFLGAGMLALGAVRRRK